MMRLVGKKRDATTIIALNIFKSLSHGRSAFDVPAPEYCSRNGTASVDCVSKDVVV
jgi:hypothetical protein